MTESLVLHYDPRPVEESIVPMPEAGTVTPLLDADGAQIGTVTWGMRVPNSDHERLAKVAIAPAPAAPSYGACTACGSVEVALVRTTGARDMSGIGESDSYPTGYGCEVCA